MTPEVKLHVDRRGRVFVENATVEVMEALNALGWTAGRGPALDVKVNDVTTVLREMRNSRCPKP